MTLDSSALIAILFGEPGYLDLVDRVLKSDVVRIGTPTLTEAAIVLTARRRGRSGGELAMLLEELDVTVVPFTVAHHEVASRAYERYGRGRHKANLNFGDCLSYAVASLAGDSLLFVGDDFRRTDIEAAG
ncbi:MAG TPA: type II toxin-antitoxin system VapC family toxin [Vicinamibacterales bacterium]|nr:type II toxin-antitoxin system VapC family toxin [Vicinamibacterales bacterium]